MTAPSLASRLENIKPSATVAITDRALALREEGRDILSYSVGEPDFGTPKHIEEAILRAIAEGKTSHYTAARGIAEVRKAIAEDSARRRGGIVYEPNENNVPVGAHPLIKQPPKPRSGWDAAHPRPA